MVITDKIFEAYLKCPTKCWLLFNGEEGAGDLYPSWVQYRSDAHRANGEGRLVIEAETGNHATIGSEFPKAEDTKWKYAVSQKLYTENLRSDVHFVERCTSKWKSKPHQIIPGRFIFTNKLSKDDKLLVAFDALVLSEMHRCDVEYAKIIHGDNYISTKIKAALLTGSVQKLIGKITTLLSRESPPDLILNRHCRMCDYQSRCRTKAVEKDELSLLAGMSAKERQQYNSEGIFTITQLSYKFRPRRHPKRLRSRVEKYRHSLKALAIRENKIHVVGNFEIKIEGTPVYLDVEGLPDRDFYYLIGMFVDNRDRPKRYSLWADMEKDEKAIWEEFLTVLDGIDHPILIHYGSYETKFLKDMCVRYGSPCKSSPAETAISNAVNVQPLIYGKVYFPILSNSLKDIARHCGFKWSFGSISGLISIVWREKWEVAEDSSAKDRLITYNADDCKALTCLVERLRILSDSTNNDSVVDVTNLKRRETFGFKTKYIWPEFDLINQAAYWDYQRDRIHLQTPSKNKLEGKVPRGEKKALVPNRVIKIPHNPTACPRCGSSKIHSHGFRGGRFVVDIKFTRCGVRKWITRYVYKPHQCMSCRAVFLPDDRPLHKYGYGLVGYVIYQGIDLMVPLHAVEKSLNKLFDFDFADSSCNKIKEYAATYYESTYISIFHSICECEVIHIDETKIDTDMGCCYVWVLASNNSVVYIATETKEVDFIQSLLNEFHGVMVTDFYAAYDAINCKQQKCLIHLMRDINNELYKHPFDDDLKLIAELFKNVLNRVVEIIDRSGLRREHLEKLVPYVDNFYDQLFELNLSTNISIKLKERFKKYKNKLFTFLHHDDVPWHNNNAEHAIKPFAILRNIIKGSTSEKGLRDYLILLSIRETCEYKNIDFLDFLLSGQTDLNTFANICNKRHQK